MTQLSNRLRSLVDSPEGRRVFAEARKLAKDPGARRRIDELRRRLVSPSPRPRKP
jgi:hypothetical protein